MQPVRSPGGKMQRRNHGIPTWNQRRQVDRDSALFVAVDNPLLHDIVRRVPDFELELILRAQSTERERIAGLWGFSKGEEIPILIRGTVESQAGKRRVAADGSEVKRASRIIIALRLLGLIGEDRGARADLDRVVAGPAIDPN